MPLAHRPDGTRAEIYLKREDLNHTGAHKINNSLGQVLLCRRMGKKRIIAETGAGQHGVATVGPDGQAALVADWQWSLFMAISTDSMADDSTPHHIAVCCLLLCFEAGINEMPIHSAVV